MYRSALAALAAVVGFLVLAPSADAFSGLPVWKCRGSAVYTSVSGNNRVEPVVANGKINTANGADPDNAQCADAEVGAGNTATQIGIPLDLIGAQTAGAVTVIQPELGKAINQKIGANARIEQLAVHLPQGGTTLLGVTAATSAAVASCNGQTPSMSGTSQVAGLTLGGQNLNLDGLITALGNLLSGLSPIIDVKTNEQIKTATSLTVRALHVKVLIPNNGVPLIDLVVAESKVGFNGPVCDPDNQNPGGQICPDGSTYDPDRNLCIIEIPGGTDIIVGKPFEGPEGGTVVPLATAKKKYGNSACLKGKKPLYAIIGTNKNDRITGTNKADRILGRGGKDSISGGRGNDCLDGGTGSDNLSGSIGNDRIYGRKGGDHLNGASGTDYLNGGSGNDSINAGFGADRVFGGSGRDLINVATAGKKAHVNCGSGRDKVRVNHLERNATKGCEVKYVFSDKFRK
jgi:Ca2+-binding RTX toxin-like protein